MYITSGSPGGSTVKELACSVGDARDMGSIPGLGRSPEQEMATHSSILAWKIPWTEEPGRLRSMGSWRVGHDWATSLSLFTSCIGEGNGTLLQCSCLENPRDGGAWWAAVYGVAQSRTWLKRLGSSSSRSDWKYIISWLFLTTANQYSGVGI